MFEYVIQIIENLLPVVKENPIFLYALGLVVAVIAFFILRLIFLWYCKINKILLALEDISNRIEETNAILRYNSKQNSAKNNPNEALKKELTKDHGF